MSFKIPEKQIIVNSDDQIELLDDDGTAYADGDVAAASDGFILEGFHTNPILVSDVPNFDVFNGGAAKTVKVLRELTSAAVKQVNTFQVTGTTATNGAVFRIVFESVDGAPTDFQNDPVSKIYQIPNYGGLDSAADIAEAMLRVINDDRDSMLETVTRSTDTITLTAKDEGVKFNIYIDSVLSDIVGTETVTTPAARGIHTYDYLKNIDWAKDLDFDRNEQWQPRKGATYTMYKFYVNSVGFRAEGNNVPDVDPPTAKSVFKLWVNDSAATFKAGMDLLVEDINPLT